MLFTTFLTASSLLASTLLPAAAQQSPLQVDCSDGLGDYLNALLTVLHTNGYTQMETAIATLSETQAGYDVLELVYNNAGAGSEYLLVPTDAAFTAGNVDPTTMQAVDLYDLVAYHFVGALGSNGGIAADAGTAGSGHAIMASYLDTTGSTNATEKVVVNSASQVILTGKNAQVTTTAVSQGDQSGELNGLKLYEVDSILTPPQSLSATLTALSSGSNGTSMNLYTSALTRTATFTTLAALPGNATSSQNQAATGLTIFAPYDAAFSGSLNSGSASDWTKVLTGMYTTKQTLYSPQFAATTSLTMASGAAVTLVTNSSGNFIVGSGGSTNSAKIIRTDVLIEGGGVMHVVDRIISASILATNTNGSSSSTGTSAAFPVIKAGLASVVGSSAAALVAACLMVMS